MNESLSTKIPKFFYRFRPFLFSEGKQPFLLVRFALNRAEFVAGFGDDALDFFLVKRLLTDNLCLILCV